MTGPWSVAVLMGFNVQNSTANLTFFRMFCINLPFCLFSLLSCRKRKYGKQHEEDRSYTKKPPNAFMLFMREQRPKVEPELRKKGSAVVNTVLGQRVSVLYVWDSQCYKLDQTVFYSRACKKSKPSHLLVCAFHFLSPNQTSKDFLALKDPDALWDFT